MALNPKTSTARRNASLDSAFDVLNSGHLMIYDSTQPTDADTALGAQVKLADLSFGVTAFAAAASASKAANSITQDSSADATGTATWGTLVVTTRATTGSLDFSVGTSSANLNMNSVAISSGAAVSVSSFTITQAA